MKRRSFIKGAATLTAASAIVGSLGARAVVSGKKASAKAVTPTVIPNGNLRVLISFIRDKEGEVNELTLHQEGDHTAKRIK